MEVFGLLLGLMDEHAPPTIPPLHLVVPNPVCSECCEEGTIHPLLVLFAIAENCTTVGSLKKCGITHFTLICHEMQMGCDTWHKSFDMGCE